MHYNTTNLETAPLKAAKRQAKSQQDIIAAWFKITRAKLTPFEVQKAVLPKAPITSIRRAITDLTAEGVLVKHEEQRKGEFGRVTHVWSINGVA